MHQFNIICRWNVVKSSLKQRYEMLTEDDLAFRPGREGDLLMRLQTKLNKSRTDIMRMIGEVN
jgi:hypothetical protein